MRPASVHPRASGARRLACSSAGVLTACALLASCASPYVRIDDRQEACDIQVVDRYDHPAFEPNPLSSSSGAASGAGRGFLAGLQGGGLEALVLAPLGALIGAGYGASCASAASRHPTANADFERILLQADRAALRRTLEARLNAPRPECRTTVPRDAQQARAPDAVLEITQLRAGMACLGSRQEFWMAAAWKTVTTRTSRVLNESNTMVRYESSREVGDWFAHPVEAREEVELLMGRLGEAMASQFVGTQAESPPHPGP